MALIAEERPGVSHEHPVLETGWVSLPASNKVFPLHPHHLGFQRRTRHIAGMRIRSCRIKDLGKPADLGKLECPWN